jgi:hypothetical protein
MRLEAVDFVDVIRLDNSYLFAFLLPDSGHAVMVALHQPPYNNTNNQHPHYNHIILQEISSHFHPLTEWRLERTIPIPIEHPPTASHHSHLFDLVEERILPLIESIGEVY